MKLKINHRSAIWLTAWALAGIYFVIAAIGAGAGIDAAMAAVCGFMMARSAADNGRRLTPELGRAAAANVDSPTEETMAKMPRISAGLLGSMKCPSCGSKLKLPKNSETELERYRRSIISITLCCGVLLHLTPRTTHEAIEADSRTKVDSWGRSPSA